MHSTTSSAVYGTPPADLAPVPANAVQVSPLIPGSGPLADLSDLEAITMLAPPGTIERRYAIALALRALRSGGKLVALAPKDKGGSRLGKELKELGCEVEEDSKRHHRICTVVRSELKEAVAQAIEEGAARFLPEISLHTQPGVFSWNRIDAGSALLLEHLPTLSGQGADLGAGLGVLTRQALLSHAVKHITMVEIDGRAVKLIPLNVDPKRTTVLWADVREGLPALRNLDFVITNPPFHDTGIEDQSLGRSFLEAASSILKPGGVAWIVANRHLPYEQTLRALFKSTSLITEAAGFKIIKAEK